MAVPGGAAFDASIANGDAWLARTPPICCTPIFTVTGDGGDSWTPVTLAAFKYATPPQAALDGSFRVAAWREGSGGQDEIQVFRIDPGGEVEPLGPVVTAVDRGNFAISRGGATWLPTRPEEDDDFELTVIEADGSTSTTTLPTGGPVHGWSAERTALGVRLLRSGPVGSAPAVTHSGTFALDGDGELAPAERYPVGFIDGELWLSPSAGRASWDAGAHWTEAGVARLIPRAADAGVPRFLLGRGSQVSERYSPFLYRMTALEPPAGLGSNRLVDTGSELIGWTGDAVYIHEGALPPMPVTVGGLEPDARAMLDRAAGLRADAGLPPLTGDSKLSQAARNHSIYTMLNPDAEEPVHYEVLGRPGFTGSDPTARCKTVGADCSEEVMGRPGSPDPVGSWLSTVYHRPLVGSPESGVVGAGQVNGGWAVMDRNGAQNILVRPFGYPNGLWRGPDGFWGESPDPVAECKAAGQEIDYPVGIAVTLYLPLEEDYSHPTPLGLSPETGARVTAIAVRMRGNPVPLRGCLLNVGDVDGDVAGMFLLDDPLLPGATYDIHAEWSTGLDWHVDGTELNGAILDHDWSFTFQPDGAGTTERVVKRCRIGNVRRARRYRQRPPRAKRKRGKAVGARLLLGRSAQIRVQRARIVYGVRGKRKVASVARKRLRRRTFKVGRRTALRLRLPRRLARRVPVGKRVKLKLVLVVRSGQGECRRRLRVKRTVRTQIVWIHKKAGVVPRRSSRGKPKKRAAKRKG